MDYLETGYQSDRNIERLKKQMSFQEMKMFLHPEAGKLLHMIDDDKAKL